MPNEKIGAPHSPKAQALIDFIGQLVKTDNGPEKAADKPLNQLTQWIDLARKIEVEILPGKTVLKQQLEAYLSQNGWQSSEKNINR